MAPDSMAARALRECDAVDSRQDAVGVLGGCFTWINRDPKEFFLYSFPEEHFT
jgi:hypothetical protein